jgi:bacterioferritin-associated ferredoxin
MKTQISETSGLPPKPADDDIVCLCFGVKRQDIIEHLSQPNKNYDTLVETTGAGTRCTACLLDVDLLINEVTGQHASTATGDGRHEFNLPGPPDGVALPSDFANSGFFINRDGISTTIRVLNTGIGFQASDAVVPFGYDLHLMAASGKRHKVLSGRIDVGSTLNVNLAEIDGLPPDGWFILDLLPLRRGLVGTSRPQILLLGPTWASAYHTQLQGDACRGRAVSVSKVDGRFNSHVSVINGYRGTARLSMSLYGVDNPLEIQARTSVGRFSSALLDLDTFFPDAPDDTILNLVVRSDLPVRKHILNWQRSGALSVDHFPNFK